ncbi:MAG: hypothetical protein IKX51_00125, partial [Bacteroidales bacterium]|nr:hypothetical protein [Bacteroidales bacterium]
MVTSEEYCNGQGRLDERMDTRPEEEMLFEMANLSQNVTGLDVIVWVQINNPNLTGRHNLPRIKFQNDTGTRVNISSGIPMSISDTPEVLLKGTALNTLSLDLKQVNKIKQWVVTNKDVLLKYWNGEM